MKKIIRGPQNLSLSFYLKKILIFNFDRKLPAIATTNLCMWYLKLKILLCFIYRVDSTLWAPLSSFSLIISTKLEKMTWFCFFLILYLQISSISIGRHILPSLSLVSARREPKQQLQPGRHRQKLPANQDEKKTWSSQAPSMITVEGSDHFFLAPCIIRNKIRYHLL